MYNTSIQSWEEKRKYTGNYRWPERDVRRYVYEISPNIKFNDLWNLLFADDAAFVTTDENKLQILVTLFHEITSAFGLTISIKKSEILVQTNEQNLKDQEKIKSEYQQATKRKQPKKSSIEINQEKLNDVYNFKYIGGMMNKCGNLIDELQRRKNLALVQYRKLRTTIFKSKHIDVEAKVRLFNLLVLTKLLFECNNWKLTKGQLKSLESFHFLRLREIMGKTYKDKITTEEVFIATNSEKIEYQISMRRLKMLAKFERMDSKLIPKIVMYGTIDKHKLTGMDSDRIRKFKNIYMKELEKDLALFGLTKDEWREEAKVAKKWNNDIRKKKKELNEKWINDLTKQTTVRRENRRRLLVEQQSEQSE